MVISARAEILGIFFGSQFYKPQNLFNLNQPCVIEQQNCKLTVQAVSTCPRQE